MHVGMASIFQNPGKHTTDREVYENGLRLACLAEPLGFDSVWTVEHHFTDYTMCPDPLQFLTYMAGRTSRVQLGSMVVVLPWHDPMRVAEQVSMLDHMSDGRFILGLGSQVKAHVEKGVGWAHWAPFDRKLLPGTNARMGEDVSFFRELTEAGVKVYVDHGLSWDVGHIAERVITNAQAVADKDAWLGKQ